MCCAFKPAPFGRRAAPRPRAGGRQASASANRRRRSVRPPARDWQARHVRSSSVRKCSMRRRRRFGFFGSGRRQVRQMNDSRRSPARVAPAGSGAPVMIECRGRVLLPGPAGRRWPLAPGRGVGAGSKGPEGPASSGVGGRKPLTLGGSGEQGFPDCRCNGTRRCRASNRRAVGLGPGAGTLSVVVHGARKPLPRDATGAAPLAK